MEMLKRFIKDERGLETVEYAIILGLIVAGTILLVTQIGNWVKNSFNTDFHRTLNHHNNTPI